MAHGVVQGAMHLLPDQRKAIRQTVELLEKFTGKKPKGWLGPGLTETWETLDYLRAEGIEYVSDWVNDDQPYEIRTQSGPLVSVPYTLELNDIPMMVIPHRIKYFEAVYDYMRKKPGVWMTTGEEIYEWYKQSRR
jgi:peptidoglycan/xylan/chitin deacetylase (PgdA/CDA1 family)